MSIENDTFDFEAWSNLARADPQAFEKLRREMVEALIQTAPESLRPRLHGLQWRIDMERGRYKHPLKSCISLFNMMWDSVYGDHGLLWALQSLHLAAHDQDADPEPALAQVIPFPA